MQVYLVSVQGDDKSKKDRFVLSIAYSPDGRRLACGGQDGTIAVFDAASGNFMHFLEGHFKPIRSLTFTPGMQTIMSAHCLIMWLPSYCVIMWPSSCSEQLTLNFLNLVASCQYIILHAEVLSFYLQTPKCL